MIIKKYPYISLILFVIILFCIFSLFHIVFSNEIINTLYTVSSIFFSILMSSCIGFSYVGIKDIRIIKKFTNQIYRLIKNIIIIFILISIIFITHEAINYSRKIYIFMFNSNTLIGCILLYSNIYFILDFLTMQKIKDNMTKYLIQ